MDIKTKPEQDDEIYDHALREIASYVLNYQIDRPNAWARARLALLDAPCTPSTSVPYAGNSSDHLCQVSP